MRVIIEFTEIRQLARTRKDIYYYTYEGRIYNRDQTEFGTFSYVMGFSSDDVRNWAAKRAYSDKYKVHDKELYDAFCVGFDITREHIDDYADRCVDDSILDLIKSYKECAEFFEACEKTIDDFFEIDSNECLTYDDWICM